MLDEGGAPAETPDRLKRRPRVLLGVTGSVAAVKCPELAVRLSRDCGVDVKVLLTRGGHNFWQKAREYDQQHWQLVQRRISDSEGVTPPIKPFSQEGAIDIHYAEDDWEEWHRLGDPVLHIDLRDWADLLVVAPLSAHSLAKMAHGLCDDTLTCVVRAWDFGHGVKAGKPLLLAPAMNTAMWEHPLTQQQLTAIQGFWNNNIGSADPHQQPSEVHVTCATEGGPPTTAKFPTENCGVHIIAPQVKTLACGEVGPGALASIDDIIQTIQSTLT